MVKVCGDIIAANTDKSVIFNSMTEKENLEAEYFEWMNKFEVLESDVDYSVFEKHKPFLNQLSQVSNSGVTVFDFFKKDFIFASYNFSSLLGYNLSEVEKGATNYFHSRIHPEDYLKNMHDAIAIMKFYYRMPKEQRPDYKFVYEYRVLGSTGEYIRIIQQYQALESDQKGNTWLAVGVMDISPDQTDFQAVKAQILNYKTGMIESLYPQSKESPALSRREHEILELIKNGFRSKEISDKLFISLHTVNTHRQRILKKLNVTNSIEAISYASKLGFLAN